MGTQLPAPPNPDADNPVLRLDAKGLLDFIDSQNRKERDYFRQAPQMVRSGNRCDPSSFGYLGLRNYSQIKQIRTDIENETRVQLGAAVKAELTPQKVEGQIGKALQQMATATFQGPSIMPLRQSSTGQINES